MVGRALREELERTIAMVSKQKNELTESASSLKTTLEAMEALKEKICQDKLNKLKRVSWR